MSATGNIDAIIVGGGIAGLALALSLKKHFGIVATVFEQAPRFGIKFKPTRFFYSLFTCMQMTMLAERLECTPTGFK